MKNLISLFTPKLLWIFIYFMLRNPHIDIHDQYMYIIYLLDNARGSSVVMMMVLVLVVCIVSLSSSSSSYVVNIDPFFLEWLTGSRFWLTGWPSLEIAAESQPAFYISSIFLTLQFKCFLSIWMYVSVWVQ